MGVDGLEKTEADPDVDGDDVQVWLEPAVEEWPANRPRSEDHDFKRMCVFRGETEGCGIFVVELVNVFIEQGCMEELVCCRHKDVRQYGSKGLRQASAGRSTNRNSGTCPRRQRRKRAAGA